MPGIEFLPDEPDEAGGEELLDAGSRRSVPRWMILAGVAVIAAAAVLVTVLRNDSGAPKPAVLPAIASPSETPSRRLPVATTLDGDIGRPLHVGSGILLDVAIAGDTTWLLETRAIYTVPPSGPGVRTPVPGAPLSANGNGIGRLVLDIPAGVLWVVEEGVSRGRALEYDMTDMQLMRELNTVGFINGAAALDGELYLTSGPRIIDVAPHHQPERVAAVSGTLGPIVADPARDRVLVADYGTRTRLWTLDSRRHRLGRPATVRVTKASLAVADGQIWLAGYDTGDGVLMRLDPRTLRPRLHSELDPQLAPGAQLVASGVVVVWVRAGDELRCVDAATGQQLQAWQVDGSVASGGAEAVVASAAGALPLRLRSCSG